MIGWNNLVAISITDKDVINLLISWRAFEMLHDGDDK